MASLASTPVPRRANAVACIATNHNAITPSTRVSSPFRGLFSEKKARFTFRSQCYWHVITAKNTPLSQGISLPRRSCRCCCQCSLHITRRMIYVWYNCLISSSYQSCGCSSGNHHAVGSQSKCLEHNQSNQIKADQQKLWCAPFSTTEDDTKADNCLCHQRE